MSDNRAHALYRFYADDGALLYVGITLDPGSRWRAHRDDKPWWHHVTSITIEVHPDRAAVLDAERDAIIAEHPRHNIVHNSHQLTIDVTDELDELLHALAGTDHTTGPWGTHTEHMPDTCPKGCPGYYLPHQWLRGRASYQCANGHTWRCSWGHDHTGEALHQSGLRLPGGDA